MQAIESIVRHYLARLLRITNPTEVDLSQPLAQGLGLSSLDIVLLITHTCKEASVSMTLLTEEDVSNMRTGLDCIQLLASKGEKHAVA